MATAARIDQLSLAWDKLESNISKWNQHPLTGFLVHGSNGEFCYLNTKERVEVIKRVKENAGPGKTVGVNFLNELTLFDLRKTCPCWIWV